MMTASRRLPLRARRSAATMALTALAALCIASTARSQGIDVALDLGVPGVAINTEFDLDLTITPAGEPFNSYEMCITYDPAKISFVALDPLTNQEGPLMVNACGQRFHSFEHDGFAGTIDLTHGLLCSETNVTGPGVVYRLRFLAGAETGVTNVEMFIARFAHQGLRVTPVRRTNATISISSTTDTPAASGKASILGVAPNPFNPRTTVAFQLPQEGLATLQAYDVRGRLVSTLIEEVLNGGLHRVTWDARDLTGVPLASGIYRLRLQAQGTTAEYSVTLAR